MHKSTYKHIFLTRTSIRCHDILPRLPAVLEPHHHVIINNLYMFAKRRIMNRCFSRRRCTFKYTYRMNINKIPRKFMLLYDLSPVYFVDPMEY